MVLHKCDSRTGEIETSGVRWPVSLAKSRRSRPVRGDASENEVGTVLSNDTHTNTGS